MVEILIEWIPEDMEITPKLPQNDFWFSKRVEELVRRTVEYCVCVCSEVVGRDR